MCINWVKKGMLTGIGVVVLTCAAWGTPLNAQQADNTATNKTAGVTADQQKQDTPDRKLAQKIRQSMLDDKSLSTYAHNVKVIVRGGEVTLKVPVQSEEEKKTIGARAADLAGGPEEVTNKLTVKS
ncbi:MAG TPA: BON domain-containing protein [Candidatus Eremiobacteraceae bacterium]|nr:BON domain-containing protein [Candidatus Eremiobacteraceae bacterium]